MFDDRDLIRRMEDHGHLSNIETGGRLAASGTGFGTRVDVTIEPVVKGTGGRRRLRIVGLSGLSYRGRRVWLVNRQTVVAFKAASACLAGVRREPSAPSRSAGTMQLTQRVADRAQARQGESSRLRRLANNDQELKSGYVQESGP